MILTDHEKAMLDGAEGPARRKAMDLLVRYGEALGAQRLVDTNNVCGTFGAATPFMRDFADRHGGLDAVFSQFSLDSDEAVDIPAVRAYSCHLIQSVDPAKAGVQGVSPQVVELHRRGEAFAARIGVELMNTCTPYQVGNVPARGEHCAWMESSAVVYCNSVLGARTNTEGRESTGAAMLTGKIPWWGLHLDSSRFATHRVDVQLAMADMSDWGLLGYWLGEIVQNGIPVLCGLREHPDAVRLKHFGAAASSSGSVELYHIPGVTPEASSPEAAFGGREPRAVLRYGRAERRLAYERVNSTARDTRVDYVMLGCPHYTLEQIREACRLLEGKRIHADSSLWIFTAGAIKRLADRDGLTAIVEGSGGHLMSDTCSSLGRVMPRGVKVAAVDSAKQAHYLPAIMGVQVWFGTTAECVEAALTGCWSGKAE